jgi:hypothetical protein
MGCEGVDSIYFPEHNEKLCVFVDTVMKLRVSEQISEF